MGEIWMGGVVGDEVRDEIETGGEDLQRYISADRSEGTFGALYLTA
jgi:hypothetical protein